MEPDIISREVVSETPTDVQHPLMYERATYILGGVAVIALLASSILAGFGIQVPDFVGGVALTATGGLVGLLARNK